ncbi:MAG TPA: hypothetical protein VLA82_03930 [Actinomycetota bacterium]|nr:hypothetical protein [Actinomycetota bacterium]
MLACLVASPSTGGPSGVDRGPNPERPMLTAARANPRPAGAGRLDRAHAQLLAVDTDVRVV